MYIACCSSVYVLIHLVIVFIINFPLVSLNLFDLGAEKNDEQSSTFNVVFMVHVIAERHARAEPHS